MCVASPCARSTYHSNQVFILAVLTSLPRLVHRNISVINDLGECGEYGLTSMTAQCITIGTGVMISAHDDRVASSPAPAYAKNPADVVGLSVRSLHIRLDTRSTLIRGKFSHAGSTVFVRFCEEENSTRVRLIRSEVVSKQ